MAEKLTHIRIVGAGLIGTSIGLALRGVGVEVSIRDSDPRAEALARDLLDDRNDESVSLEQLCIIATPPDSIAHVISQELSRNPDLRVMDVSSIKTKPLLEVSRTSLNPAFFAATHPMAGREVSGPESARGDLFVGRPWVLISDGIDPALLTHVKQVIALCGGAPIIRSAADHDRAVAQVSHLPQILSSLLAGSLNRAHQEDLELAGSGLRDTTRLADSNPELWGQILSGNAEALRPLLISLQNDLSTIINGLDDNAVAQELIASGRRGRARIPGKHGGQSREYFLVAVVIEDKPGQLAAIIESCAQIQVNIEDLQIEHTPGQETGLITLSFAPQDGQKVMSHLQDQGWKVHPSR